METLPKDNDAENHISHLVIGTETKQVMSVPLACGVGHNSQVERALGLRCWP